MATGEEWCKRVLWTLPLGTRGDSEKAFELRLRLARNGHADGLVDWSHLAKDYPCRAIQLIEAVLSTFDPAGAEEARRAPEPVREPHSRLENWLPDDVKTLLEVAGQATNLRLGYADAARYAADTHALDRAGTCGSIGKRLNSRSTGSPTRDF